MSNLYQKKILLDERTNKIVDKHVRDGGFGGKGVSAAIRNIISEWDRWVRYRITDQGRQALEAEQEELGNPAAAIAK